MTLIGNETIHRASRDFVEVLEGPERPGVRFVYQVVRFLPPDEGRPLSEHIRGLFVTEKLPEPNLPSTLAQQTFWDRNAVAVVLTANRADDLHHLRKKVEEVAPKGWRVTPSRYAQVDGLRAAVTSERGAISLENGVLQCLVS